MQHDNASSVRAVALQASDADPLCAGRESELNTLGALYRDTQRGDSNASRLVLVEGPSGIGKSRLLGELRSRVRLEGGVVLEGRCEPGQAFGPFAEIVDRALRFLEEVGAATRVDLAGLACTDGCHRLWHQHGGLEADRPTPADDLPGANRETAAFEKRLRFFDAIAGLLREVAQVRAPLVLIDRLETADRGTLDLLSFLLESAAIVPGRGDEPLRALFVSSVRCEEGVPCSGAIRALRDHARTSRIEMGVLDLDGVRAYLHSQRALQRILERTGGHPEAIDLLLEGAPLTPEERLAQRLGALPPVARAAIEALAVLGRPAALDELCAVADVAPNTDERAAIGGCDLLGRTIHDGGVLLAFERAADAERCYRQLDGERKRALHARAAEVCGASINLQEAVRHALAAGDHPRASDLALIAAASLSARHGHAEAAALLESFLAAVPGPWPAIREQLAELYRVTGEYSRALVHARAIWAASPDELSAAHRVGQLLTMAGEHDEAATVLLDAERRARRTGDRAACAELEAQLAELHYQRTDFDRATTWAERALCAAAAAGDLVIEVQARNALGKLALAQKQPHAAMVFFEENRQKARDAGLGHQEAQAHTNLGVALLLARDLKEAEQACRMAIEVASRASDTRECAIATENLAVLSHLNRDYKGALAYYHRAVTLLKRLGNRPMLARVAHNLGELYASIGDHGRARMLWQYAQRVGGEDLPPQVAGEGLLLGGRIEAAEGNVGAARSAFLDARQIFTEIGSMRAVEAALELARLALRDGDLAETRQILAALPVELSPNEQADLALVSTDLERASGGDARAAARRAVELAEACEDSERLLSALVRQARALGEAGEVGLATRVLERAQKLEQTLGAQVPEESRAAWTERPQRQGLAQVTASLASAWTRTRHESVPPPPALRDPQHVDSGRGADAATGARARPRVRKSAQLQREWQTKYPKLVGETDALATVFNVLDKVAVADALVLVRGESGTGKELVAEAIHENSPRRGKPFVKVNCAALVETLLLSELFGHERGAFTGASARKKGRFELADGGTIFLDEIGDISAKTQVALLRVLQEREFERVGGTQAIRVDVRIVAATHRDLEQMVRDGSFREDLYYRLCGVSVEMPPLRERLADLPVLSDHLLARIAEERGEPKKSMSSEAVALLSRHSWPGNVRELDNVLRSATLFAEGDVLMADDLAAFAASFIPPTTTAPPASHATPPAEGGAADGAPALESLLYERIKDGATSLVEMKKMMERECIQRALDDTNGNITHAAALLGMKRPRLSQLVKQYRLKAVE